jgi:cell division protein FtsL
MADKKKMVQKANGQPKRIPKKIAALWMLALIVLLAEALVYTWCGNRCVQTGYAIDAETRRHQELTSVSNNLNIELAHLKAPETISRIAREQFALGMPDPKQIIVVP